MKEREGFTVETMIRLSAIILTVLMSSMASIRTSLAYADYHERPDCRQVLEAHHIKVTGSGMVDIPFPDAVSLFVREDLLDVVQHSYARLLPPGKEPEFIIQPSATNQWYFVNRHAQTSIIEEVHRSVYTNERIELVYYSEGQRFFGDYRSIVEIGVEEGIEFGTSRYEVTVYAYPLNSVSRFFARHLGIVERFFRKKTEEITSITLAISQDLTKK